MADSVFNRLVQEISPAERKAILGKISDKADFSQDPLTPAEELDKVNIDLGEVYKGLGFLARVLLFFKMSKNC